MFIYGCCCYCYDMMVSVGACTDSIFTPSFTASPISPPPHRVNEFLLTLQQSHRSVITRNRRKTTSFLYTITTLLNRLRQADEPSLTVAASSQSLSSPFSCHSLETTQTIVDVCGSGGGGELESDDGSSSLAVRKQTTEQRQRKFYAVSNSIATCTNSTNDEDAKNEHQHVGLRITVPQNTITKRNTPTIFSSFLFLLLVVLFLLIPFSSAADTSPDDSLDGCYHVCFGIKNTFCPNLNNNTQVCDCIEGYVWRNDDECVKSVITTTEKPVITTTEKPVKTTTEEAVITKTEKSPPPPCSAEDAKSLCSHGKCVMRKFVTKWEPACECYQNYDGKNCQELKPNQLQADRNVTLREDDFVNAGFVVAVVFFAFVTVLSISFKLRCYLRNKALNDLYQHENSRINHTQFINPSHIPTGDLPLNNPSSMYIQIENEEPAPSVRSITVPNPQTVFLNRNNTQSPPIMMLPPPTIIEDQRAIFPITANSNTPHPFQHFSHMVETTQS